VQGFKGNVNILQHLQSDRRDGASTKLFLNLYLSIQFYFNNVTNLRQLTSEERQLALQHRDYIDNYMTSLQPIFTLLVVMARSSSDGNAKQYVMYFRFCG